MKTIKLISLLMISAIIGACASSMSVTYDYNKTADFGNFKTFALLKSQQEDMSQLAQQYPNIINTLNGNRLQTAIISEMEQRGYKQVSMTDKPDLVVTYYIKLATQTEYQATTTGYGGGIYGGGYYGYYGGYRGWGGMSTTSVTPVNYNTGSILIDVVETSDNTLVWYGAGSGVMDGNPSKIAQNIPIGVAKIFAEYKWVAGQAAMVTSPPSTGTKK